MKSKVDKLHVDKLVPVLVGLSKVSYAIKKMALLKEMYVMLRSKIV